MAETKDKVVTVESLSALHDYNKTTYLPVISPPVIEGNLSVNGNGYFSGGDVTVGKPSTNNYAKLVKSTDVIPLTNGGTNATNGEDGLKNLFASGKAILSSNQYGDTLPDAGTVGRIFFKKLVE